MKISICNGRLIDPAQEIDAQLDLHIEDGKVVALGAAPAGFQADRSIDASGQIVCPGLIDLSARLREPGLEHKATIESETRAAAASGITTLCCPPDTDPVVDTPAVAKLIRQRAQQAGYARVLPLGAMTRNLDGTQLNEMAALKEAGCVGISNLYPLTNTQIQRRAMEYAATFDLTVFVSPVEQWLQNDGCVHEGSVSTRLGLPGIPAAAETTAVARELALVEQLDVRVHFCRLSTARAVRMVARAQHQGLPVSADVCAHQLHLTETDIGDFNSLYHVQPPLRTPHDRDGLRKGVAESVIGAICSDHQPHEPDAKLAPFCTTEPGISSLETLLPLTLRLVDKGILTLPQALARLTHGPATILGIDSGTLQPGSVADICIFDPEQHWELTPGHMVSQGRNTPFAGATLKGKVTCTLFEGNIVYSQQS